MTVAVCSRRAGGSMPIAEGGGGGLLDIHGSRVSAAAPRRRRCRTRTRTVPDSDSDCRASQGPGGYTSTCRHLWQWTGRTRAPGRDVCEFLCEPEGGLPTNAATGRRRRGLGTVQPQASESLFSS